PKNAFVWRRRYFMLVNLNLYLFKSSDATELPTTFLPIRAYFQGPTAELPESNHLVVHVRGDGTDPDGSGVVVERIWTLLAPDDAAVTAWLDGLRAAVSRRASFHDGAVFGAPSAAGATAGGEPQSPAADVSSLPRFGRSLSNTSSHYSPVMPGAALLYPDPAAAAASAVPPVPSLPAGIVPAAMPAGSAATIASGMNGGPADQAQAGPVQPFALQHLSRSSSLRSASLPSVTSASAASSGSPLSSLSSSATPHAPGWAAASAGPADLQPPPLVGLGASSAAPASASATSGDELPLVKQRQIDQHREYEAYMAAQRERMLGSTPAGAVTRPAANADSIVAPHDSARAVAPPPPPMLPTPAELAAADEERGRSDERTAGGAGDGSPAAFRRGLPGMRSLSIRNKSKSRTRQIEFHF
ncbi:hypothetical protein HK405_000075, partial [Cladochytrium tenue]